MSVRLKNLYTPGSANTPPTSRTKPFSKQQDFTSTREDTLSDMRVTILEKIYNPDPNYREERESMWIRKFNTKYKGINRNC